MGLNSSTSKHESFQSVLIRTCPQLLIVATANWFIFCSNIGLPRQNNLVVMSKPTAHKVCIPIVDFELSIGHSENAEVFFNRRSTGRGIGKNSNVDLICKGCMEVTNVTRWVTVCKFSIETDVVFVTVHPAVPRRESNINKLVRFQSLRRTCCCCVSN